MDTFFFVDSIVCFFSFYFLVLPGKNNEIAKLLSSCTHEQNDGF